MSDQQQTAARKAYVRPQVSTAEDRDRSPEGKPYFFSENGISGLS